MPYDARLLVLATVIASSAAACRSDPIVAPGITAAELCAKQTLLVANQQPVPTLDDIFETMSYLLPGGFGGLTSDYWYLKQPVLADTARATAVVLSTCPDAQAPNLWRLVATLPVRTGDYDWIQLRTWYRQLLALGVDGMTTSDIDEGANRLHFTFGSQAALDAFRTRVQQSGVPPAAVTLSILVLPPPLTRLPSPPSSNTDLRP